MFSARERAALAYRRGGHAHEAGERRHLRRAAKHFDEREIAELTLANAIENFYNLLNLPLEVEADGLEALAAAEHAAA